MPQTEREQHILKSVMNALDDFNRKHANFEYGSMKLYIDNAVTAGLDTEIFIDTNYTHYPLRNYETLFSTLTNVIREYDRMSKRNKKKDDNHLNKHAMHLIRLFLMAIDILDKGVIKTHRVDDLELLMKIRNGGFQKEDHTFTAEFYDMLTHFESELERASKETTLPDNPDMDKVGEFVEYVNRKAIEGDF
jgi:hypothetical protein